MDTTCNDRMQYKFSFALIEYIVVMNLVLPLSTCYRVGRDYYSDGYEPTFRKYVLCVPVTDRPYCFIIVATFNFQCNNDEIIINYVCVMLPDSKSILALRSLTILGLN